jgi:hypothetical protein
MSISTAAAHALSIVFAFPRAPSLAYPLDYEHQKEQRTMSFRPHLPMPVVFDHNDPAPPAWEYHTEIVDLREMSPLEAAELNALGKDGWLLAGLFEDTRRSRLHYHFVRSATR